MPLHGLKVKLPVDQHLGLKLHVKDNEILDANWIFPVFPETPFLQRYGYPTGWVVVDAITTYSRFVQFNQIYSPVDGRPFDEVLKERGSD